MRLVKRSFKINHKYLPGEVYQPAPIACKNLYGLSKAFYLA